MRRLLDRAQGSRSWRAWNRYAAARGNVLAGGIAYMAFFSLFPALAVGFTVFGLVLGGRPDLQEQVATSINDTFGATLIGLTPDEGVVTMDQLIQDDVLTVTGAVGMVLLLLAGLGWVAAMREAIRAVFSLPHEGNPVLLKLGDVAVLVVVGLGVVASAVVTVGLSAESGRVLELIGVTGPIARMVVRVLVEAAVLIVDVGLFLVFFRVLAQVRAPWRELLSGAVIGAVGLHVLKLASGLMLRRASGNTFLAGAAILVGLLLWFNLVARFTLLAAAWSAASIDDAVSSPAPVEPSEPAPATAPFEVPTYGQRAGDRTALAAGAVLGGLVVAVVGGLTRSARHLSGAARSRAGSGDVG